MTPASFPRSGASADTRAIHFAEWFEQRYRTLYAAEFAELERLNRELDDVAQPLRLQMEAEYGPGFWKR